MICSLGRVSVISLAVFVIQDSECQIIIPMSPLLNWSMGTERTASAESSVMLTFKSPFMDINPVFITGFLNFSSKKALAYFLIRLRFLFQTLILP